MQSAMRRVLIAGCALSAFGTAAVQQAHARQEIVVYTVLPEQEINREVAREFTRRMGIEVEMPNVPKERGRITTR